MKYRRRMQIASFFLIGSLVAAGSFPTAVYARTREDVTTGVPLDKYELEIDVEKPVHLTGISLSARSLELKVRGTQKLTYTMTPVNANDAAGVTWSSSDESVAAVENGLITAKAEGTAVITVTARTTDQRTITDTCSVQVVPLAVEQVTLNYTSFGLKVGDTKTVTASITPENATYAEVTWESSDSTIAKVEDGVVTALRAGTAVITASCENGLVTASCTVYVSTEDTYAASGSINTHVLWLPYGHSYQFTVSYEPIEITRNEIKWSAGWGNPVEFGPDNTVSAVMPASYFVSTDLYFKMAQNQWTSQTLDTCKLCIPGLSTALAEAYDWYVADGELHITRGDLNFTSASGVPWLYKSDSNDCGKSITSVVIGEDITSIGNYTFNGCENLASITIPASVSSISGTAFSGCTGLTEVTVHEGMPYADADTAKSIFGENAEVHMESHTYENGVCTLCGAVKTNNAAFCLSEASLSLNGDIRINYYVNIPAELAAEIYVCITSDNFGEKRIDLSDLTPDANGDYLLTYDLPARGMHDTITLKAYDRDDQPIEMCKANGAAVDPDSGFEYSVAGYIQAAVEYYGQNEEQQQLLKLLEAAENYGSAAQRYFRYNEESADFDASSVADITKEDLKPYALAKTGTMPTGLTLGNASLVLRSNTELRLYFKTATGCSPEDYRITVNGENAGIVTVSDGSYYVSIPDIAAQHLEDAYTISFGDGSDTCSLQYSCLSYAYTVLKLYDGKGTNDTLCDTVKALYVYNAEANKYFDEKQ